MLFTRFEVSTVWASCEYRASVAAVRSDDRSYKFSLPSLYAKVFCDCSSCQSVGEHGPNWYTIGQILLCRHCLQRSRSVGLRCGNVNRTPGSEFQFGLLDRTKPPIRLTAGIVSVSTASFRFGNVDIPDGTTDTEPSYAAVSADY